MKNIENNDDLSQEKLSTAREPHQVLASFFKESVNLFQSNPCPIEVKKADLEHEFEYLEWNIESLTARKNEIKRKIEAC